MTQEPTRAAKSVLRLKVEDVRTTMDDSALAADILLELRDRVAAGGEGSLYGDKDEALRDLDRLIQSPSAGAIQGLLAPTANLQELSMEWGWGAEFNILAARLEKALGIA